jgi:HEAT repeat protein
MTDDAHDSSQPPLPPGPPRTTPDDALPPVEPPSAGFIVQLFVIPAVIVAVIVIVWALFNWLAHMGTDPRSYVEALRRNNESRWQEAVNLANELNKTGNEKIKQDSELARELADLLNSEIDAGQFDEKPVTLRVYLCRVLGEFHVPDVLPTLIKAAKTERDERERDVRLAALQGLARLIPNLNVENLRQNEALRDVLIADSKDSNNVVRYHAAYTLGVLGGDAARKQLEVLLDDGDVDVRMNAATGLARHGDPACIGVLVRMLDPTDAEAAGTEKEQAAKVGKQITVELNALEAAAQLKQTDSTADLKPLAEAVDRLIAAGPQAAVRAKAEEVKRLLAK